MIDVGRAETMRREGATYQQIADGLSEAMRLPLSTPSLPLMFGLWCCAVIASTVTRKTTSATVASLKGPGACSLWMTIITALTA